MISIVQALILGIVQGFTELFPISSLGHSVIIPHLFGWNIHQNDSYFLTFLVATHLATAIVLFLFFWKDWVKIVKGLSRSLSKRQIEGDDTYAKLGWLLIVATVPAGILGLLFEQALRKVFASAQTAAFFLIVNAFILFAAEKLRKRSNNIKAISAQQTDKKIAGLSWSQAVSIGGAQSLALFPGISRSGASMAGGLLAGLNNEEAARFSFLLATPIIGAAALLKLPDLFNESFVAIRVPIILGSLCAAATAFLSVRFLIHFFQTRTLKPFAVYCFMAGVVFSTYFLFK